MANSLGQENDFKQNSVSFPPKEKIRHIVAKHNLDFSRKLIKKIAAELNISFLDCAAALAFEAFGELSPQENNPASNKPENTAGTTKPVQPGIRLVRYRLDIGFKHKITIDELKKVLVEESGVDVRNIVNVCIQNDYTCIDLPDEMPQEIFHHLKDFEINSQKLAIRRLKPRNKKRSNRRFRSGKRNADHLTSANRLSHETKPS